MIRILVILFSAAFYYGAVMLFDEYFVFTQPQVINPQGWPVDVIIAVRTLIPIVFGGMLALLLRYVGSKK